MIFNRHVSLRLLLVVTVSHSQIFLVFDHLDNFEKYSSAFCRMPLNSDLFEVFL